MKIILEAVDLKKVFRVGKIDVPALRGVDLQIKEGEFLAVMGPSGCGKSTLLHILGGLLTPTSGRVIVDGMDISAISDKERTEIRRQKIGFVFQRYNLFPTLTALQNLELARQIHSGKNGHSGRERLDEILELLGLKDKMNHKPLEMSGGEQQRLALARAILTQPAIVLADEPTGNLDSVNSQTVLRMLRELNRKYRQTIVMITHEKETAAVAHRIVEMKDGRIINRVQNFCYATELEGIV
ncbi:MAG: ABC transporter ATP-binding protein [Acidobacteria bacterium]|nr:ABC transporter ATP-binding protein [Acidobacteriota bacterium]